jgi:hypothetical protein
VRFSYPGAVEIHEVDEFLQRFAPGDVQDTVAWLADNGYTLTSHSGESAFGAQFVYAGDVEVVIGVDRSQWLLDIVPRPGAEAWQYDLLLAAYKGLDYGALFPKTGSRSLGDPLPDQLPEGVSWRGTLPEILEWVNDESVPVAVDRALDQRFFLMWGRKRRHRTRRVKPDPED